MDHEVEFEWDEAKNLANQRKHDIDFESATDVFSDPFHMDYVEEAVDEVRFNVLGMVNGRLLHVTYTQRGDICRIISARKATRHEKRKYHEVQA